MEKYLSFKDLAFAEYYFSDAATLWPPKSEIIEKLNNPFIFHQAFSNINWDSGFELIIEMLNHKSCDYGTALMAYWLMSPKDCIAYKDEDLKRFNFFKTLESRLLKKEFATQLIAFDPNNFDTENLVDLNDDIELDDKIPEPLKKKAPGIE